MIAPEPLLSPEAMTSTEAWLHTLVMTYHEEVPIRLHSSSEYDLGGAPAFDHGFEAFIERDCRKPDCFNLRCKHGQDRPNPRKRTHKALRKLRRIAPREFDALYLMVAHQMTLSDVARSLTDRAIRLNKPERYNEGGVLILLASGIDKVQRWW